MKQNQLSRAINNLGTDLQVSKHWWPENILDSKEICGIVGFDISAWFKEMERETRILLLLLLLQLPSNVHSIGQEIHTRSAYNLLSWLHLQEWCGWKPIQTHPGGSWCLGCQLPSCRLGQGVVVVQVDFPPNNEAHTFYSGREVTMEDWLLPIAWLTLAEVSRWMEKYSPLCILYFIATPK